MTYKKFETFFLNMMEKICKNELDELKNIFSPILYNNVLNRMMAYIEHDLIRLLYKEYQTDNKDLAKFTAMVNSKEYLENFLKKYSLLYEKLEKKAKDYIQFSKEIFADYYNEREEIKNIFGKDQGDITDIVLFQGDNHNGKSAALVRLKYGQIYYKPGNDLNMRLFYELLEMVLHNWCEITIDSIKSYSNYEHTWMEEVECVPCEKLKDVRDYYFISGVYLSIFYVLGSYDMHFENVISKGATPIIIDYETLLKAPISKISQETQFRDSASSIINSSFVPFISDDGPFDINLSGILCKSDVSQKSEQYIYYVDDNEFSIRKVASQFIVKNQVNLNNNEDVEKYINLEEIRKCIRKGFFAASLSIIDKKEKFIEILKRFLFDESMECRQLLRPTQVYHQFVQASMHPDILKNAMEEEKLFFILEKNFKPKEFGYIRVEEEIEKMKLGYIPKFYTYGNSKDLYSNGQIICKEYFSESIFNTVRKKIDLFDLKQVNYQMRIIDLSILNLLEKEGFGKTRISGNVDSEPIDFNYVKNVTSDLVDRMKQESFSFGPEINSIFMPHLSESTKMWRIKDMELNLYENGGVIQFLMAYGYMYDDLEALKLAMKLLNYLNLKIKDSRIKNLSVYSGKGCLAYLNYNLYKVLQGNKELCKYANKYKNMYVEIENEVIKYLKTSVLQKEDFDYINGIISTLYFVCKVNKKNKISELVFISDKIANDFQSEWINEIGFAHGITGVLVCISELYKNTKQDKLLDIIENLILKENQLIHEKGFSSLNPTWCRGTTGIIYGRELILKNLEKISNERIGLILDKVNKVYTQENMFEEIKRAIRPGNNLSLCHGVYGNIEIFLKTGIDSNLKELLYHRYFNSFNDVHWVEPLEIPIDMFMLGNSGVAYVLLELFNSKIPSVLALDSF